MSIEELGKVRPVEELVTISAPRANGRRDPVARIARGNVEGSLVVLSGEPWQPPLGEVFVDHEDAGEAHLGLRIKDQLAHEPGLLQVVIQAALQEEGVEAATFKPGLDTNLSELDLRRAGALAVTPEIFEFRAA